MCIVQMHYRDSGNVCHVDKVNTTVVINMQRMWYINLELDVNYVITKRL